MTAEARVDVARAALHEITPPSGVGDFRSETDEGGDVFTLLFETTMAGYPGWAWTVSVAEVPGEAPTVLEAELLPGEGALLAPDWLPWADRLEEYRAAQAAAGVPADEQGEPGDEVDDDEADLDDEDGELDDLDDDDDLGSDVLHAGDVDGVEIDEIDEIDETDDDDDPDDEGNVF